MLATSVIGLLCTAGVAFYVRFLLALGKNWKPHRFVSIVLLPSDSHDDMAAEVRQKRKDR
jgi:hypothetical protein